MSKESNRKAYEEGWEFFMNASAKKLADKYDMVHCPYDEDTSEYTQWKLGTWGAEDELKKGK